MVVIWAKTAINDLKSYSQHSEIITEGKLKNNYTKCIEYSIILKKMRLLLFKLYILQEI